MCNKISFALCCSAILFFSGQPVTAQSDSALLNQIKNMNVSLTAIDDSDEDLYMMTVDFQSFYDELSPDGEWIQITKDEIKDDLKDGEGQGYSSMESDGDELVYIWKPSLNDGTWSPYTNGRWEYTTGGWIWVSNYSWGWAVYHYGRWWNSPKYGWVWLPGYVWAPAWVEWRVTEGHIGWCPLSPFAEWRRAEGITISNYNYINREADWVFVEKTNFAEEISRSVIVPSSEYKSLLARSQSIVSIKSDNGKIMNSGPDLKDMEAKTGKTFVPREIKVTRDKIKTLIGEKDVTIFKPALQRLEINPSTGKAKLVPHPKKFRRSPRARIILRRMLHRRIHIRRR